MAKSALLKIIGLFLGKAMPYVCNKDSKAYEIFESLPQELRVSLGILNEGDYLTIFKSKNQILVEKSDKNKECDLKIYFKNRKSARLVFLGKISVAQSFARHDILLAGNINTAISLVGIIDICEYYLFPRFITYKFLPKMKKEFCSIPLYFFCLFGKTSSIKFTNPVLRNKKNKQIEQKEKVKKPKLKSRKNENTEDDKVAK